MVLFIKPEPVINKKDKCQKSHHYTGLGLSGKPVKKNAPMLYLMGGVEMSSQIFFPVAMQCSIVLKVT